MIFRNPESVFFRFFTHPLTFMVLVWLMFVFFAFCASPATAQWHELYGKDSTRIAISALIPNIQDIPLTRSGYFLALFVTECDGEDGMAGINSTTPMDLARGKTTNSPFLMRYPVRVHFYEGQESVWWDTVQNTTRRELLLIDEPSVLEQWKTKPEFRLILTTDEWGDHRYTFDMTGAREAITWACNG